MLHQHWHQSQINQNRRGEGENRRVERGQGATERQQNYYSALTLWPSRWPSSAYLQRYAASASMFMQETTAASYLPHCRGGFFT